MRYCPKCREKFQDWVTLCPDCKIPLVDKLPEQPAQKPEPKKKPGK